MDLINDFAAPVVEGTGRDTAECGLIETRCRVEFVKALERVLSFTRQKL